MVFYYSDCFRAHRQYHIFHMVVFNDLGVSFNFNIYDIIDYLFYLG